MGQAAGMPSYQYSHVNYPRQASQPVVLPQPQAQCMHNSTALPYQQHEVAPSAPPLTTTTTQNTIIVPVHYYPNSFYTASASSGSFITRIDDALDEINSDLLGSMDGNRFLNRARDPNIPPPPGHLVQTQTYVPIPTNTSVVNGHFLPTNDYNVPPIYATSSFPPSTPAHNPQFGGPPPYTPRETSCNTLYPNLSDTEKSLNKLELGTRS